MRPSLKHELPLATLDKCLAKANPYKFLVLHGTQSNVYNQ